jgi:hypothetical protein
MILYKLRPKCRGPAKWQANMCTNTSTSKEYIDFFTMASSISYPYLYVQLRNKRIHQKLINRNRVCKRKKKTRSTLFTWNCIWIRYHIHHHFLWRVFPVAKSFEINLNEQMGNIMSITGCSNKDTIIFF